MKTKSCRKCSPQGKRCDCPTETEAAQGPSDATTCYPSSDTPETDREWNRPTCQDHPEFERNLADFARKLEREREKIRAQLREEQRLHIQTLNERDEARKKSSAGKTMSNNCQHPEMCLLSETCVPCAICPNAKGKADDRLALTPCSASFAAWLRDYFGAMRFDEAHHLGLGDIRLTIGQQDDLVVAAKRAHVQTLNERDEANAKLDLASARTDGAIQQTKGLIEFYRKQKP